jgi:hypothetical protein
MTAAPRVATNKYRSRVERWFYPASAHTKEQLERQTGGVAEKFGDGWRVVSFETAREYFFHERD